MQKSGQSFKYSRFNAGYPKTNGAKAHKTNSEYVTHVSHSQNFITDKKIINRIVHLSNIDKNDTVIEIGTGKGHLTEALCRKGGCVYSVEIDRNLYESTKEKLSHISNLRLIHGDFLNYSLPKKGDYKVFANIPYFITTQIVEKLTQVSNLPVDIWLVMEKGAAKRFAGLPRETEKSLLLKVNWETEIVYHFRREDFHPMPSVDSVLLHFVRKAVPDLNRKECGAFRKFIEHGMKYGICGKNGLLTKRQVSVALKQAGLPDLPENGATLYIQWLCLFRCYQRIRHS
ncbi:MAG: 23S ribosomal RNA methyltransferase Erm [Lachnospiraceae bacterium]|nr:23S ribosomal RNA methyltransferase Erm [Lachnospiraceae bacterium]